VVHYSELFVNERFEAPEGTVTAQIKNEHLAGPDRLELLLWFYDQSGKPIEANLTIVASRSAIENNADGVYGRSVIEAVQRWLKSNRVGEPIQVLER
jgi:peptidoglycan hydrolase-like protein with peptidoglycan-binding domain